MKTPTILLVEDNEGDVKLTQIALNDGEMDTQLEVVGDGEEALDYLHQRGGYAEVGRPDLVLLDLNLPKINGFEVLEEVKRTEELKSIPIIILTTSDSEHDIRKSYELKANCYINKPVDFDEFAGVMRSIRAFWLKPMEVEEQ